MRRTLSDVGFAWRTVWDAYPVGAVAFPVVIVLTGLAGGPLLSVALGRIVNGSLWPWVVVPLAALAARGTDGIFYGPLQTEASHRTRHALRRRLLDASTEAVGVEHLESAEHADRVYMVRTRAWATTVVFSHLPVVVSGVVSALVALVLLGTIEPVLVLAGVVSLAGGLWEGQAERHQIESLDRNGTAQRQAARIAQLATGPEGAQEVRLFGLSPELVRRHRALTAGILHDMRRSRRPQMVASVSAGGLRAAATVGAVAWLVVAGTGHHISVGHVVMGIALLLTSVNATGSLGLSAGAVAEWSGFARHLSWLLDYRSPVGAPTRPAAVPVALREGVRLEDVEFTYPGAAQKVLDGVRVDLFAGSTVALVGDNGAGKTTLAKLLLRLYDPDVGRITVDGTDLRELDPREWRTRTSAAFQDFLRPHTSLREAVGMGELGAMADEGRIRDALGRGGAAELVTGLADGIDAQLGRDFSSGVELSAGQWQRLALARAAMRPAPLLLLLDEPTASLDPVAEHEVFERFVDVSAPARGVGGVTLIVSHRFSTVSMADLIVVLHDGRIIERGTHQQLLGAGGRYANLYRLQAAAYR